MSLTQKLKLTAKVFWIIAVISFVRLVTAGPMLDIIPNFSWEGDAMKCLLLMCIPIGSAFWIAYLFQLHENDGEMEVKA